MCRKCLAIEIVIATVFFVAMDLMRRLSLDLVRNKLLMNPDLVVLLRLQQNHLCGGRGKCLELTKFIYSHGSKYYWEIVTFISQFHAYPPKIPMQSQCANIRCEKGSRCTFQKGVPICLCPPYLTGRLCETRIRSKPYPCINVTCLNGGRCVAGDGVAMCQCTDRFVGIRCENSSHPGVCPALDTKNVDKCGDDVNCSEDGACKLDQKCCPNLCGNRVCTTAVQNDSCDGFCLFGGNCTVDAVGPRCTCPAGYTGKRCEIKYQPHPGTCPRKTHEMGEMCQGAACTSDDDCKPEQKCCRATCGPLQCIDIVNQ